MSLDDSVGKSIADFCGNGFTDALTNHCAHFVSHQLKPDFDMTCRKLTGRRGEGANVRVQELFARCPEVGWLENWSGGGQVYAALRSRNPVAALTKVGEERYPERCKTLRATIQALEGEGKLGEQRYEPAHGLFVPA